MQVLEKYSADYISGAKLYHPAAVNAAVLSITKRQTVPIRVHVFSLDSDRQYQSG